MRWVLSFAVLTALATTAAFAADTAKAPQDREPDWLKKPTREDLLTVWPTAAMRSGRGGKTIIACIVTVQGRLRACRPTMEKPEGMGFGAAAVALTPQFSFRPALKGGVPVESEVRIPIDFKTDGGMGSLMSGGKVLNSPPWAEAPTYQDLMAAYPAKARARKEGGMATLNCAFKADGRLRSCETLSEVPTGLGFSGAAKSLTTKFRFDTALAPEGEKLTGIKTHLTITFPAAALDSDKLAIGKPKWSALPTIEQLTGVIPDSAFAAKVERARVVLSCRVAARGALTPCEVVSEEPVPLGLGPGALRLSSAFRLSVWTDEGLPTVGGAVRVPIQFRLKAEAEKPAAAPVAK